MKGRDRIVLTGLVVLALLAGVWIMVVSPERKQASTLSGEVSAAETQLSTAQGQLANARQAQTQYASAYSSLVSLGKAVPTSQEVPALIDQLTQASHERRVDFSSIVSGAGDAGSATAGTSASASTSASAFSAMPFNFTFNGSFFDLEHLFRQLTSFTTRSAAGTLSVRGRLLTIQSVKLSPASQEGSGGKSNELTGAITASAYVLPGGQTLTGAAGASTPSTSLTPTTGAASSPAPAAIVTVKP
jgi:Tfp pilus assembly protein PilO